MRHDEQALRGAIIETAQRWVEKYPRNSPLHEHGLNTLAYWDEQFSKQGAAA